MGGYGSTRWGWHNKRLAVEDCRRLPFRAFKHYLRAGWGGQVAWSRNGEVISTIGFEVKGSSDPTSMLLIYTITRAGGEKIDCRYSVNLTTTSLPWGGLRYWFTCPGLGCGRRVNVLYLAPGGKYFTSRHCNQLSYRSRQEGYQDRMLYRRLAGLMQDVHPGVTWKTMREVFKER